MKRSFKRKSQPYTFERSWNYVLWLLSRRAYTVKQLRDKLGNKEALPDDIDRVIEKLIERKFVDDEAYADMYVRSRQRNKGPIKLRQELFHKGVAEDIVDKTVASLDTETQLETSADLLERNAWRFKKDDRRKNYAKAYAFLARRGFGSDVVKLALEQSGLFED